MELERGVQTREELVDGGGENRGLVEKKGRWLLLLLRLRVVVDKNLSDLRENF